MSETELLREFRESRSEEAFAQLVRRYSGLVYAVAKRRLGNGSLAEDVTQIVFVRLANKPPKLGHPNELTAWLHRTTLNVTIDTWRVESRRRAREQRAIVMESADPETPNWSELSSQLDGALNELTDDDRQTLLLRFFGQKSMREVGATFGISEDAAKMRVSRALDRLRKQLRSVGGGCTATGLADWLIENSVEAAPDRLVKKLSTIKLSPAMGTLGLGGLFSTMMRIPNFNLIAGVSVLAVIGIILMQMARSINKDGAHAAITNTNLAGIRPASPASDRLLAHADLKPSPALPGPSTANVKILFQVVDSENNQALPGTKIQAAFFGPGGAGEGHELLTDSNGTAAIPYPDDPTKSLGPNVFVTAEGHVPKVVGFRDSAPAEYLVKLDPALTVGGRIVDDWGQPVPGVTILIQGPGNGPGQVENVDFQTCPVTSHEDGSWNCSYIPQNFTNEIRFILKKEGFAVTFPIAPGIHPGLTNLVLVMNQGFTIIGRITREQGQPIANANVKTLTGDSHLSLSGNADENGVFVLAGVGGETADGSSVPPAWETNDNNEIIIRGLAGQGPLHVDVLVAAKGFAPQIKTLELTEKTNLANFTLLAGNIFRGRIVDEAGNPIAKAAVRTDYDLKNQIPDRFEWFTQTDDEGRFEWDSAPGGAVSYWFEAPGFSWIREMPLVADGREHVITLKPAAAQ